MTARRIAQVQLTVADLARAEAFYATLGFTTATRGPAPDWAALLGARQIDQIVMRRAGQELALQQIQPQGAAYPADASACDQIFQHCALPVAALAALPAAAPISRGGPQHLPQRSGGATAYKFRDPDGHPLELIRFPDGHRAGIDHSAIVSSDVERSIAFYQALGFRVAARQTNTGAAQDRLDGLQGAVVDVVALEPPQPAPHLELLAYRHPAIRPATWRAADIAGTRLVIDVATPGETVLRRDPDGHLLVLRYTVQ